MNVLKNLTLAQVVNGFPIFYGIWNSLYCSQVYPWTKHINVLKLSIPLYHALKHLSTTRTVGMKTPFFWDLVVHHWVFVTQRFETVLASFARASGPRKTFGIALVTTNSLQFWENYLKSFQLQCQMKGWLWMTNWSGCFILLIPCMIIIQIQYFSN
jgi:hypothetical protein